MGGRPSKGTSADGRLKSNQTSKPMKSSLSKATNAKRNTVAGRAALAPSNFGLPAQRKYRIDDAPHARDALARVAQNGTPAQKAQVRKAVAAKYPSIAVSGLTKQSHGDG